MSKILTAKCSLPVCVGNLWFIDRFFFPLSSHQLAPSPCTIIQSTSFLFLHRTQQQGLVIIWKDDTQTTNWREVVGSCNLRYCRWWRSRAQTHRAITSTHSLVQQNRPNHNTNSLCVPSIFEEKDRFINQVAQTSQSFLRLTLALSSDKNAEEKRLA